jgi:hypothetical protein
MKRFDWNTEKSQALKEMRGVCFEDVILCIEKGKLLDDLEHPNAGRYPHQRIMVIDIDDYAYLVPYVEHEEVLYLKTIIPSRKASKKYLGEK